MSSENKRIVVLQRGWVAVGDYFEDGNQAKLENASIIRRWGTSKGLGQLALEGPQSNTVLDKAGTLRFRVEAIVTTFDVDGAKWPN